MVRVAKIMVVLGLLGLCGWAEGSDANLVAYWAFDEGSGMIAYDSAGSNNGTIYGDGEWVAGQVGGALSFDGVNDYVDCGSTFASVTGSTTKSIMAWVRSDSPTAGGRILTLYRRDDMSTGFSIFRRGDPATWQSLYMKGSYSYEWLDSGVPVTVNEWTHIALVQDAANVDIYINGVSENSASNAAAPAISNPINADIGAYAAGWSFFSGTIDEVRIYNRALSAEEVEELYLDAFSGSELAIMQVDNAIAEKEAVLDGIDAALEKELVAYEALEELLESKDYGDLKKGDVVKAKQGIGSAIQRQEQAADALEKSIEKLEDALAALGWEPELEPNLLEP